MTYFEHTQEHELDCNCSYCKDVDPNKSVSRELERYVEELTNFAVTNLSKDQAEKVLKINQKILLLRRYFPEIELPHKHSRLVEALD